MSQRIEVPDGIDRLPVRYRRYIEAISAELRALHDAQASQTPTRVYLQAYSLTAGRITTYLPDDEEIVFVMADGEHRIIVSLRDVHAMSAGRTDPRDALLVEGSCGESRMLADLIVRPGTGNQLYLQSTDLRRLARPKKEK